METVLVTGATGTLGRGIVDELLPFVGIFRRAVGRNVPMHISSGFEAPQYIFSSLPSEKIYEEPSKKPRLFCKCNETK